MDFRIDELNQGLSLGLIVTVFTGMYFFASSIYLLENYVSPHFGGETYCFCPVRLSVCPSVRHTVCQRNSS